MHMLQHILNLPAATILADVLSPAESLPAAAGNGTLMLLVTIFVVSVFVGVEIIVKIPPTLHTPLMSGSNAISGITVVGAILEGGRDGGTTATVLGLTAVILATINVVGGFVVTDRMLSMFKSKSHQ
jgi:NAD(P) transhydrogenase subunit alpha